MNLININNSKNQFKIKIIYELSEINNKSKFNDSTKYIKVTANEINK